MKMHGVDILVREAYFRSSRSCESQSRLGAEQRKFLSAPGLNLLSLPMNVLNIEDTLQKWLAAGSCSLQGRTAVSLVPLG
jgi:hypothetical protein